MRSVILATAVLAMIGASSASARGRHGHHQLQRHQTQRHSSIRSVSSPSSKQADSRSPEKRDPEDTKIDRRIKSICRGC